MRKLVDIFRTWFSLCQSDHQSSICSIFSNHIFNTLPQVRTFYHESRLLKVVRCHTSCQKKCTDDMEVSRKQKMLRGAQLLESINDQMAQLLLESKNGHHTARQCKWWLSPVGKSTPKENERNLQEKCLW